MSLTNRADWGLTIADYALPILYVVIGHQLALFLRALIAPNFEGVSMDLVYWVGFPFAIQFAMIPCDSVEVIDVLSHNAGLISLLH